MFKLFQTFAIVLILSAASFMTGCAQLTKLQNDMAGNVQPYEPAITCNSIACYGNGKYSRIYIPKY